MIIDLHLLLDVGTRNEIPMMRIRIMVEVPNTSITVLKSRDTTT
jgi:hypothetical protein